MSTLTLLKPQLQNLLRAIGLYHRLKTSRVYDAYWKLADKRIVAATRAEVAFYRRILRSLKPGDLIFDIGANQGHKTDIFLRLGARVVAVDPDEYNQDVLRCRFLRLRLFKKPVTIVAKAISGADGATTFWVDAPGSAKNTLSAKWVDTLRVDEHRFGSRLRFASQRAVQTTSLQSLIATHGIPIFVKIDVEGHELEVLRGLRTPVPFLSFEVNLPEFRPEGEACIKRLVTLAPHGKFNYAANCTRGLLLDEWLDEQDFMRVFTTCAENSVEVFWRTDTSD